METKNHTSKNFITHRSQLSYCAQITKACNWSTRTFQMRYLHFCVGTPSASVFVSCRHKSTIAMAGKPTPPPPLPTEAVSVEVNQSKQLTVCAVTKNQDKLWGIEGCDVTQSKHWQLPTCVLIKYRCRTVFSEIIFLAIYILYTFSVLGGFLMLNSIYASYKIQVTIDWFLSSSATPGSPIHLFCRIFNAHAVRVLTVLLCVRFEVFTATSVKTSVSWVIKPWWWIHKRPLKRYQITRPHNPAMCTFSLRQ
jgi:hypothetical protein